jgi:hypothetical protein
MISKIEYLSGFNANGYNNQPYFINSTELLASIRLKKTDNNDIYKFDVDKKTFTNITNSKDSEYSPRTNPADNDYLNCVSVPYEDTSIQNLIEISTENGALTKTIFNKFAKIGYYRYIKNKLWVCYLVEEPHVLSLCDEGQLTKKIFASSIGRSFEVINQNDILFVHKITADQWKLKSYNLITEKSKTLAEMPKGIEDFAIDETGKIYCASDSKILRLTDNSRWQTLTDLAPLKIKNINRLAITKNRMAIVSVTKP